MHCVLGNANANANEPEQNAIEDADAIGVVVLYGSGVEDRESVLGDLASRVMVHARSPPSEEHDRQYCYSTSSTIRKRNKEFTSNR